MSEEKRPVLSLKRKPAPDSTPAPGSDATPGVVRRKKVVVVSAPPAWKVKKEKLEQAKKAAEAAARQAVAEPVKAAKVPPPVRYLQLLPPEQAIMTLKAFWPQLFDNNSPRLLATGMREQLFADIERRDLPLSHKQVIKCLKSLTRSAGYLSRMREGASRYDLQGNVVSTVTAEEARYASERMMKELLRAERKMSQTI
ncbi:MULTISPECIES: fertility inhibition protein FinO [Klebsiella]|uniref:Fertility inhibition protein n=2 Tax=Klebsiella TaxID=570 RepID=A0A1Q8YUC0_9ENTR|nr:MULTISPECIES: fertility inhibition protein FinO [Klebsiella]AKL32791.1 conjugal transfer protein [Klebsiella oxytoca]AYZ15258.1 fertility inhibition protein FinO [Klebsiella sp. FDAARGOS_511]ELB7348033.1 fertility inhibition protein FinO [Klebsiella michiganensis]ELC0840621.1 fertility inhibition protein FinO [Klebsiella michiganensis]ELC2236845.1 fertility inhibition protein FinO [Klebsiella michiganensis]